MTDGPSASHIVADTSAKPRVWGQSVLEALDLIFLRVDRFVDRWVHPSLNPMTQTGAIANTALLVAIASGIALLFWYSPSVTKAYDSVETMGSLPYTAGIVRSLHRYSSDACMLFVLLHALKLAGARRFTGPRWIAWVTGVFLIGSLWLAGWLGYWLVWDQRAQQVALGTARMLDLLPIVTEPLSREFLTEESINSLLFFMVFFVHMLIPLPMAVALWLHIVRVSRSNFLTGKSMTAWTLGGLLLAALVHPADSAAPARMQVMPEAFTMDWWYLLPMALTDRLQGGLLWTLTMLSGTLFVSVPWALRRGRPKTARVDSDKCNACRTCYRDCPYEAISMVPRPASSKRGEPEVAYVDPARCVGCGICAGSCNTAGVGLDWIPTLSVRRKQDRWLDGAVGGEVAEHVAFVCAESAASRLAVDPATGACGQLPGYRVEAVPCAGWVHALTVERALRHGAKGVLVVTCADGDCSYREGARWAHERLEGERRPFVRSDKVDKSRVRLVELDRAQRSQLPARAEAFRRGEPEAPARSSRARRIIGGVGILGIVGVVALLPSDAGYGLPGGAPELVVSFNHAGQAGERCRELSADELAQRPAHMRTPTVCERGRAAVRLRVDIDGESVIDRAYEPGGISADGNSLAMERLELSPGPHVVAVEIGDGLDPKVFEHRAQRTLEFEAYQRRVVLFDKDKGISWH